MWGFVELTAVSQVLPCCLTITVALCQRLATTVNNSRKWHTYIAPAPNTCNDLLDVPSGGLSDPPILMTLIHAIKLTGRLSVFKKGCRIDPARSWLVEYPTVSFPNKYKSFQGAAFAALTTEFRVNSLAVELHEKAKTTLLPLAPFDMPIGWFDGLHLELMKQTPYIKICW